MGADASTAPLGSSKSKKQVPIFHQILIVLHGSRKSGKTSLLRRMNGLNIIPQYTPTKCMQASEIIWHPICMSDESIKIIVWDVVGKAIDPTPQSQRTKQLPDATNVDTFSRADGIIVIYDPRDEDSIKYARSILDQAPQSKPTLIVMNFADSFEKAPSVPSLMEPYTNSFFHLTASMKTNQGLAEIANWLDLPMNVSLSKIYELHLKQSEEKLNSLLKEFNLTGFNEDQEPSQSKEKESSKDFWSNENEDHNADTFGTNEVSADFFMDDDESDLKAKQNLEKLKKKLNITELEEEEDNDEEFKLKMAKKKSKILSKNAHNNANNQSNKLERQDQNQDEDEYSDNEYNNEDGSNKTTPQVSIPQISFDIPVVAENDNNFFEEDKDDHNDSKEIESDDVDNKLEELKKKLKLEIPKEEEDEAEKPKVKKSKILPKVKPPQIIIKPAQPKVQQQQTKTEINSTNSITKEIENDNKNTEAANSNKIEIPTVSNEKDSFFSDGSKSDGNLDIQNQNDNTTKVDNFTMPSFDDNEKENIVTNENTGSNSNEQTKDEDVSIPSNEKEIQKEEPTINIPTISDVTLPSFGNDDFFGDDDENDKENQLDISKMTQDEEEENPNRTAKKSKILPKKDNSKIQTQTTNETDLQQSESATTKATDEINISNPPSSTETDSKQIPNITLPTFGDDFNFFSDENKKENEIKTKDAQFTLPTFDDDSNFFSDDNKNENKIDSKDKLKPTLPTFDDSDIILNSNKNENETKTSEASFTLPNFGDDSNLSNKNENKEETKTKENPTLPTFDDNSDLNKTQDQKQQQPLQFPDITFPSFDTNSDFSFSDENQNKNNVEETKPKENPTLPTFDDNSNQTENQTQQKQQQQQQQNDFPSFDESNFFSDKNEKDTKTREADFTVPSFDVNFDADGSKAVNFFNDDDEIENKSEQIKQDLEIDENDEIPKKKKSIILPKQNAATTNNNIINKTTVSDQIDTSNNSGSNQNEIHFDSFDIKSDLDLGTDSKVENNDSFFTEKVSKASNEEKITDLPPPPPIDFSNSFLSEKAIPRSDTISTTNQVQKNQNEDSDLDILNRIRQQEAERAEKARQNAALLESVEESKTQNSVSTPPVENSIQNQSTVASSSISGDYEAFDDTPQQSTRERRHRKHGSSHRSHRHRRKGKNDESDGQNDSIEGQSESVESQNDESYMSFD